MFDLGHFRPQGAVSGNKLCNRTPIQMVLETLKQQKLQFFQRFEAQFAQISLCPIAP